jgi:uncharacterized protein YdhG (YjbR/CyaY superfamily)
MNATWHKQHVLPKGASLEQRIAWHREHEKRCACRPIPPTLLDQMRRDPAIDDYLAKVSPRIRALLRDLRDTIHAIVPEVEECISYRMPAFRYDGRIIGGFAATSSGCSYYPFSGTTLKTLANHVQGYGQTKGALHFDTRLPALLVRKLLTARIAEGRGRERKPGLARSRTGRRPRSTAPSRRSTVDK